MTQTYFPFDSGQGANAMQAQWQQMAQNWLATGVIKGVLNELSVYADSTGMQCKAKSGQAWMKGHFFQSDAEEVLPIATADSTNPRIDRIIVRVDWVADTVQLAVLQGVPATSPTAPALTQNTSRWEISLAQVYVGANVSTIAAGNITDERYFIGNLNLINTSKDITWTNLNVLQNGWVAYNGPGGYPGYRKDIAGNVWVKGTISSGTTSAGTLICTLPAGYRPKDTRYFTGWDGALAPHRLKVDPNGNISIPDTLNSNVFLTLDLIAFPAEQ